MSVKVAVEVFTDPTDIAYHGHEGIVVRENIEIAPAVVLINMSRQLQALSVELFREAQTRDPALVERISKAAGATQSALVPNRAERRAAGRRGGL